MAIVCLEGASGVGKSTVAARLGELTGAAIVAEVNLLFGRSADEPRSWYFERQAERWRIAVQNINELGKISVLDGDPFQPLWYNWAYGYDFGEPAEQIHIAYASLLAEEKIRFPERYFHLSADEPELRTRKDQDKSRIRKNFERHLRFIRPQRVYFEFLNSLDPGWVTFIENENVDATARVIAKAIEGQRPRRQDATAVLEAITTWLSQNEAAKFIS